MKCSQINNKIIAYLENELPEEEMKSFRNHVQECDDCRKLFTEIKKTWQLIDAEKDIQPDDSYFNGIEVAIQQKNQSAEASVSRSLFNATKKIAAVLLLLISVATGILLGSAFTGTGTAATYQDEYEYFSEIMYLNSSETEPIENYLLIEEDE